MSHTCLMDGKTYRVRIGSRGRLVIPAQARRQLGLEEGTSVVLRTDEGRLIVEPRDLALARLRSVVHDAVPAAQSLVDELLESRRRDGAVHPLT